MTRPHPDHTRAAQRGLLISLILLLLSGCATQITPLSPAPHATEPNAALWHWQLQARTALSHGNERQTANLDWQQQGPNYQLRLFGPFGQGAAYLSGAPFLVTLTLSNGEQHQAATPEQLLARELNWPLPLSNLVYWVRGLPAPGPYRRLEDQQIEQDGWQIQWSRFSQQGDWQLPGLIDLHNPPLSIRMAIHTWQPGRRQMTEEPTP
ncbi:lipoprotein insertase outer membrane protein LolB [Marinospirillum sp.]|uniref:lipoprotein insertase outer membrane protein LolB n=1 Tax=Marinospirillum sp. TaxID=2183934 RepID=UPI003A89D914